jgi:hypothetical protein
MNFMVDVFVKKSTFGIDNQIKVYKMKKVIYVVLIGLLGFVNSAFSQSDRTFPKGFEVKNNPNKSKQEFYSASISNANLENFRLRDKSVVIKFSEGFECVLISATELKKKYSSVNVNQYKTEFPSNYTMPKFSISENGVVMIGYYAQPK